MTDIFQARDRLLRAVVAEMDARAAIDTDDFNGAAYMDAQTERLEAAKAYWELARGRKWPE